MNNPSFEYSDSVASETTIEDSIPKAGCFIIGEGECDEISEQIFNKMAENIKKYDITKVTTPSK